MRNLNFENFIKESEISLKFYISLNNEILNGDIKFHRLEIIDKFMESDKIYDKFRKIKQNIGVGEESDLEYMKFKDKYEETESILTKYLNNILNKGNFDICKYLIHYYKGELVVSFASNNLDELLKITHYYGLDNSYIKSLKDNLAEIVPSVWYVNVYKFKPISNLSIR